jgi:hypothetical protein
MNTKDKILKANDTLLEAVHVPEWDCTVHVRGVMASEFNSFLEIGQRQNAKEISDIRAQLELLIMCLVDKNNRRIFDLSDIDALECKSFKPIARLSQMVLVKSGMLTDQKELEKN